MVNAAASAECADLLNRAGEHFYRGAYLEARPLWERALAIREKVLGPEHPRTALSLNNLASLLHAQDNLAGSRPLYDADDRWRSRGLERRGEKIHCIAAVEGKRL
jgi:hypothetical protein